MIAPIMATWLLSKGNGSPTYVTWYLSVLGVIACVSAFKMHGSDRFAGFAKPLVKSTP